MIQKLQREREREKSFPLFKVAQQLYSCDECNENKGETVEIRLGFTCNISK